MNPDAAFPTLDPQGSMLGDEVYAVLGAAIIEGRLSPGERVRDVDLAARLGVSRTPVREALQRLERTGLVEVAAHRYTRVSKPNDKQRADTHDFLLYMVGNVLRIALRRCTDDELSGIIERIDEVIASSRDDDAAALMGASATLFVEVARAADNAAFLVAFAEAEVAIRRNLSDWSPHIECPVERTDVYEQFGSAVAVRDGVLAESILHRLHGLD